ncbi:MAG: hypothetical protein KDC48_01025 [Planctomycetes bacterium]|nr:hypothetical protein [Planctomycetota bacterium]
MRNLLFFAVSSSVLCVAASAQGPVGAPSPHRGCASIDRVLFDAPADGGPLWALGRTWKAGFDGLGVTVIPYFGSAAPQNFPLRLEVAGATVGGQPLALEPGAPRRDGECVCTPRGALTEVVATGLDQLEQSFVFTTLPNRGAIAVEVRVDTELAATPIDGGLRFANAWGHVDYTKAVAVDAAGQRQALDINWTGAAAHIEIPAAFVRTATLPIVLDPTLNYWYLLGSSSAQPQYDSGAATIQALGGRTLMTWRRQFSATDQDCFGLMFDGNLGLVATDFPIDIGTEDWQHVAVAGNNYAQNFLVVAEANIAGYHAIRGSVISAAAVVGARFDIERAGSVGFAGNNYHPDVGGDPYGGPGYYTVVFHKQMGASSEIYFKQVTPAGGLAFVNPILLSASNVTASKPSISKSCGQSNGLPAYWFVTWQQTYPLPPNDQEVYGRYVNWNGAVIGSPFGLGITNGEETAPSAGSPIDAGGVRYWPMTYAWSAAVGLPREVRCRVMASNGGYQTATVVSAGPPGTDAAAPEMDSDGNRFVVAMNVASPGLPRKVEAVTLAYLPASNSLRVEARSDLQTVAAEDYADCDVCADFSGGPAATPRYVISFSEQTWNTFRLAAFGGYAGSTNFFAFRPSQCGALPITASGSPVLGQTVRIDVGSSGITGTLLGFPGQIPINAGCNCWLGVTQGITFVGNQLQWLVPTNAAYVGLPLAVQGWSFSGSQCLGTIDISDTVDFTIR